MYKMCWKCVVQIRSIVTSSSLTQVVMRKHLNILITEIITAVNTDNTSHVDESDNKGI
jgi:hypothetical protein